MSTPRSASSIALGTEAHVVEHDFARSRGTGRPVSAGCGTVVGVSSSSVMREIATPRLLVRVEHLRQLLDRCEEQVEVQQERDQRTDVQRSVGDEHAAGAEHDAAAMSERKSTNGK